nr:metalloendoproteinase 3-mmp [Quercus suber]
MGDSTMMQIINGVLEQFQVQWTMRQLPYMKSGTFLGLGVGHSSVQGAIMWPSINSGVTAHRLHQDDIDGIKALYNS